MAVDPGLRACGVAIFDDGFLTEAYLVRSEEKTHRGPVAWQAMVRAMPLAVRPVRVEFPKAYYGAKQQADHADLLELAAVVGALAARYEPQGCGIIAPAEWKGQLSKEECRRRIRERLDDRELLVLDGVKDHNVWDAVGIGLHATGRFVRRRVIAR